MAGQFLTSLETGDLRVALSAVAWTMLSQMQQGLAAPLKCAERGPTNLPPKTRASPLWFWLEIGRSYLQRRSGLHRGWPTMHAAIADAFYNNYKRWTPADRMRLLLAWILQLRASLLPQQESLWTAPPVQQQLADIDLPYQEIAGELANPNMAILGPSVENPKKEMSQKSKSEAKMAEADAAVMAALGITDDDH